MNQPSPYNPIPMGMQERIDRSLHLMNGEVVWFLHNGKFLCGEYKNGDRFDAYVSRTHYEEDKRVVTHYLVKREWLFLTHDMLALLN